MVYTFQPFLDVPARAWTHVQINQVIHLLLRFVHDGPISLRLGPEQLKKSGFLAMGVARLVGYQPQSAAVNMWLEPTCKERLYKGEQGRGGMRVRPVPDAQFESLSPAKC